MDSLDITTQMLTIKVPDGHDSTKPLPLCITTKGEPNVWATGDGRRVFGTEEWALKSMEMDTKEYRDRQRARSDAGRLVRAVAVDDYTGWVTKTGDEDDYAQDVSSLLEKYEDQAESEDEYVPPAWVFCCTEDGFDFDLESQLDCYLDDNHHESARDWLVDEKELWGFWNAWAAKQNLKSYMIDYKRIVVIDRDRYEAELAAAKTYLEATA